MIYCGVKVIEIGHFVSSPELEEIGSRGRYQADINNSFISVNRNGRIDVKNEKNFFVNKYNKFPSKIIWIHF